MMSITDARSELMWVCNHKSNFILRSEIWGRFQPVNYLWCWQFPTRSKHRCVRMKYSWEKSVLASDMTLQKTERRKRQKLVKREAGNGDFSWEFAWLGVISLGAVCWCRGFFIKHEDFGVEIAINKISSSVSFHVRRNLNCTRSYACQTMKVSPNFCHRS